MSDFRSDNVTGACPQVMAALERANRGSETSYGGDAATERLAARMREVFERDCQVFPVATGTAANALSLAVLTPPWGAVLCHEGSHIHEDECGAPEFYAGGAKLVPLPGAHGRLDPETVARAASGLDGSVHQVRPSVLSLTQATEAGTLYRPDEVAALAEAARARGLALHMDGARFANAVAALGCTPAELTWKAGVEVLSFGATKNGALAAEAVVLFRPGLEQELAYRRKRGGHLFSKQRFLSAQLEAYLEDGLWLANARHANALAARLAGRLQGLPGLALAHRVEANEVFARLPAGTIAALRAEGFRFHGRGPEVPGAEDGVIRLVTAWSTSIEEVDRFAAAAGRLLGDPAAAGAPLRRGA